MQTQNTHQHISTSAHQHISTSAHQHISTSAHQKKWVSKILKLVLVFVLMANFKVNAQNPVVAFGCNKINLYTSDTITFINTSTGFTNTTKFIWNFGMACGLNPNGTPILDGCNDTTTGNMEYVH